MMGREIRRVPPNWQHPTKQYPNHRLGRMEDGYQPMRDKDAEEAFAEWNKEYQEWLDGEFDKVMVENPNLGYSKDEPYKSFCAWHGTPPNPDYYRPKWDESAATWYQVYETVSEGTPVTPPFATKEELVDYLTTHGDFWDQKRRKERVTDMDCGPWDRAAAQRFVDSEWAPSLVVTGTGQVMAPRDGIV